MSNTENLSKLLDSVYLGGGDVNIKGCVLTITSNTAQILAADLMTSLYVQSKYEFISDEDFVLGIGDLPLFIKLVKSLGAVPIDLSVTNGNKLQIKPTNKSSVKYLLGQVDLITNYDAEWEDAGDRVAELLEEYTGSLDLTDAVAIDEILRMVGVLGTSNMKIVISKRGEVSIQGGTENTHEFSVVLGKCKEFTEGSINVFGPHVIAILKALDPNDSPTLHLHEAPGMPIVINSAHTGWILNPQADDVE